MRKWIALSIALPFISAVLLLLPDCASAARTSDHSLYKKATGHYEALTKDPKKRRFRSEWERVIGEFESVAKKYPSSPYAGYAMFARAEATYGMYRVSRNRNDLNAASERYESFAEDYPDNENAPEGLSRAASICTELGDRKKADALTARLAGKYPNSIYAAGKGSSSAAKPDKTETATAAAVAAKPGVPPSGNLVTVTVDTTGRAKPHAMGQPATAQESATQTAQDPPPASALNRVSDIRHWSNPEFTKVVIELDGEFTYEKNQIANPDRLYFDIKGAFITGPLKDRPIEVNDGILKGIRTSQYNQDTVRVVLDLASVGSYNTLMLPDPPRLVVDISGANAVNPAQPEPLYIANKKPADDPAQAIIEPAAPAQAAPVATAPETTKRVAVVPDISKQHGICVATIVLDPGHGGKDPGATGKKGLKEKDVVLDIALRLRDVLYKELGCKVVLTREKDEFIDLDDRPGIAIKNDASLFISIHANASRDRKARGIETYLLNTTKDRNIMELAARENLTTVKKMSNTFLILKDLVLENKREDSLKLAHAVQAKLVGDLSGKNKHVNDRGGEEKGVKQGPFFVLYGAETPSILTEVGFISNPEEEKLLASPEYRQKIAEAIYNGIKEYIANSRVPTYEASLR